MSEGKNFSRRRRGGMRFRPSPDAKRKTLEPRVDATAETAGQNQVVFDKSRLSEIDRSENIAAGLPADGAPRSDSDESRSGPRRRDYREPHLDTPAEVKEEFKPVEIEEKPKGFLEAIKFAAQKVIKKVQRLIKPVKKIHKEVIINAESLETRVGVVEEGKLEEFTIERTTEERLVGSIYKGRVRNLEDGLKAAFVDIGFEKNAFLHYWDIVPNQFDSSVEIVERDNKRGRPEKPKITQRDIPRVYPPGRTRFVVTRGPLVPMGPLVTWITMSLPGG